MDPGQSRNTGYQGLRRQKDSAAGALLYEEGTGFQA